MAFSVRWTCQPPDASVSTEHMPEQCLHIVASMTGDAAGHGLHESSELRSHYTARCRNQIPEIVLQKAERLRLCTALQVGSVSRST